jgi:hypothetical protein
MKYLVGLLFLILSFVLVEYSFAQAVAPIASPAVAVVAPAASIGFLSFLKSNLVIISGALYFIIDIVILLSPGLAANGLLHQVQLWLGKESGQIPPAGS